MIDAVQVLLADDEVEYAASLARALRRRGMVVSVAHDGDEVVEALKTQDVDVVVMDLRMPRMDGLTALDQIRTVDAFTSVILLSGNADLQLSTEALKRGATDFLFKPCPIEVLTSAIEDAAERKSIARELGKAGTSSPGENRR
jgi:DNA-binding NtrC family response regulator